MAKGGPAWDTTRYGDTINERAVRILLECILVDCNVEMSSSNKHLATRNTFLCIKLLVVSGTKCSNKT